MTSVTQKLRSATTSPAPFASPSAEPAPGNQVVSVESAARLVHATKVYGADKHSKKAASPNHTEVRALDNVSVNFARGRFTSLMGPSGSGKSTLLHCAAALNDLTSGTAYIGGRDISTLDDKQRCALRCNEVGFVFQAFNLVPTLNAAENMTLPLDLARKRVDREWFEHVVHAVGLWDRRSHRPHELSGGQRQRVAVARALLARPAAIFADEPTGNLDSHSGAEVLSLLRRAVDEFDQTVVMVTHDANAAAVSDEVLFMTDGRIDASLLGPDAAGILDHLGGLADRATATAVGAGRSDEEV